MSLVVGLSLAGAATAQVRWTGGGDGTSWNDSANWSTGAVPTASDDVVINYDPGASYTITVSDTRAVASITQTSGSAHLDIAGRLTVGGAFEQAAGDVGGSGTLIVEGLYTLAPSDFAADLSTATITLNGGLTWTDGDLSGPGVTTVNGPATMQAEGCILDPPLRVFNRRLEFNAAAALTAGCINPQDGATIVIGENAVFDFQAGETGIQPEGGNSDLPTLINNGLIVKTAGTGSFSNSTIGYERAYLYPSVRDERLILQNNGTIRAEVGTIGIYVSEGSDTGGLFEMTGGSFTFYQANEYDPTGVVDISGTVQGGGGVQVYDALSFSGTLDLSGTLFMRDGQVLTETLNIVQLNELRVRTNNYTEAVFAFNTSGAQTVQVLDVRGRMALNTDLTVANRFMFGVSEDATLFGTGNLTIPAGATMEWGYGRMGDGGTLTIAGTLTSVVAQYLAGDFMTQQSQATLDGRDLVVTGNVVWDDAPLYLNNGAVVDVRAEGTFDFQRDGRVVPGDSATTEEQFVNAGTVAKSGVGQRISSGSEPVAYDTSSHGTPIAVPFFNDGILALLAGRTAVESDFENTGQIVGTDTLDVSKAGTFTNMGVLDPGTPEGPGVLTVKGPLDVTGATVKVDLGGPTPGTEHDQVRVTGNVQLGGILDVQFRGYDPPGGTSFTLVSGASLAGTFGTVSVPSLTGRTAQVAYDDTSTVLQIQTANAPPTAAADTVQTQVDTPVTIDVLANDTDADGDSLSLATVAMPSNGTAEIVDRAIRYTPAPGFVGEDAFSYTISDGQGGTDSATVHVSVISSTGVLAGQVTAAGSGAPIIGATVTLAAIGRTTPTGSEGFYTFEELAPGTYSVEAQADGYQAAAKEAVVEAGGTTTVNFALAVASTPNTPPVAADDAATTLRGASVIIDVLANDTDADGDVLTVTEVTAPSRGTATVADGRITYAPNDGATGTDTFTYTVSDGRGGTDQAQVTVRITAFGFAVTNLGTLGGDVSKAVALNAEGQVVGVSTTEQGAVRAFIWEDGTIRALPTPEGDAVQVASMNATGNVVGTVLQDTTSEAFIARVGGSSQRLGSLGGAFSAAHDISAEGQVVGTAATAGQAYHAFRWTGTMTDLGAFGAVHSEAFGINDAGTAVGAVVDEAGTTYPFVGATVLEEVPSGRAYDINAAGQVVGSRLDDGRVVARQWHDAAEETLPGLGGDFAEAYAVNQQGWAVGTASVGGSGASPAAKAADRSRIRQWRAHLRASWVRGTSVQAGEVAKLAGDDGSYHAVLWVDGTPRDLNDYVLDPNDEWTLIEARAISDEGEIVGYGRYRGALRAFVLTPADNAPPQPQDDMHRVTSAQAITLDLLSNDRDHEAQPLRIVDVLDQPRGTVRLTSDSTAVSYMPPAGFQGTDRFRYRVSDGAGGVAEGTVHLEVAVTAPAVLRLYPNYPNPFRTRTTIRYELPTALPVRLALYDVLGRRVAVLVDEEQRAGMQEVQMDAAGLASGIYLLRLAVGSRVQTRRLTVVR